MGIMKHVTDYFFERFGPVTIKSGDVCTGAGSAAQMKDFGEVDSNDLYDLLNSRTIVIWGKNLYVSSIHLIPTIKKARDIGTRVILVDPVHNKTVNLSDQFVQPRPGGDMALALGLARVLFERGSTCSDASKYCDHFSAFKSLAMSRSIDVWAELADVSTIEIEQMAAGYSDGPSAILVGWGMQRRIHGSATIRVLDALGAVSGNIGIPGGGVSFYYGRRGAFELSFLKGEAVAPRTIPEPLLGPSILEASDPPIRMVWVTAGNPVAMLPESNSVAEALRSRELTVVVDSFMTDTARCAHVVLPTTTMLEEDDLLGAYGHHWLVESRPIVDTPPGVKTDYEIVQALAAKLGMANEFSEDVESWKRRLLSRVEKRGASLGTIRRTATRNPLAKDVMFAGRKFFTPNGRANLVHQVEIAPANRCDGRLQLMALSTEKSQASQWEPETQRGPAVAVVHPEAAPHFIEGELAKVKSDIGELLVRLSFDSKQRQDVILMEKGGWLSAGRCANTLIKAKLTDAGGCAVFHDTSVRLMKTE